MRCNVWQNHSWNSKNTYSLSYQQSRNNEKKHRHTSILRTVCLWALSSSDMIHIVYLLSFYRFTSVVSCAYRTILKRFQWLKSPTVNISIYTKHSSLLWWWCRCYFHFTIVDVSKCVLNINIVHSQSPF